MCTETNWELAGYDGPSSIKIKLAQFLQFDSVENFNNKRLGGSGGHLDIDGPAGFWSSDYSGLLTRTSRVQHLDDR